LAQNKKDAGRTEGVKDLYAEPITGGKYIDIEANREAIGRYGSALTM
jgi:Cu(I)/Ag(I) efflux system membrane protein CusA/SilA